MEWGKVYASGGEGAITVPAERADHYSKIAQIQTVKGARISLFVPDLNRFFLAVRQEGENAAAITICNNIRLGDTHSESTTNLLLPIPEGSVKYSFVLFLSWFFDSFRPFMASKARSCFCRRFVGGCRIHAGFYSSADQIFVIVR